jgi:hypothetical protein
MRYDLHVRDVGQGVERDMAQGPDPGERQHQHRRKDQEAVAGAALDDPGQHHMPPSALRRSCFAARLFPSLLAVTVTCQEPPDSSVPGPS